MTTYREAPPPRPLAGVVTCTWTARRDVAATTRVVPDGCTDLMLVRDRRGTRLVVAGPDTRAQLTRTEPGDSIVGIRFAPGAAAPVLGLPLDVLRDGRPELGDLWGGPCADRLLDAVADADDPEAALAAIVLERRRGAARPSDAVLPVVRDRLADAARPTSVRALASELGLSERQLRRRCHAGFGYGAKTLHRILRFQRALALARAGHDLARVAAEAGYADQPHLAHEVADLSGTTLTALRDT